MVKILSIITPLVIIAICIASHKMSHQQNKPMDLDSQEDEDSSPESRRSHHPNPHNTNFNIAPSESKTEFGINFI